MSRILVVEDDSTLSMGIEFALKKEGFEVLTANTVERGLELFKTNSFDLLLLDIMLPDGTGYQICSKVRESSTVPVIFLTACDEEVNVVMGLDLGGDDYITKPFRVRELVSRIKAALRRWENSNHLSDKSSEYILSGAITLYPFEARVLKNSRNIELTAAEYKLLSALMRNRGQILTREVIFNTLWDTGGDFVDDNTLSVYIRRLREKLEENPSEPEYIITVRGLGYRWGGGVQ